MHPYVFPLARCEPLKAFKISDMKTRSLTSGTANPKMLKDSPPSLHSSNSFTAGHAFLAAISSVRFDEGGSHEMLIPGVCFKMFSLSLGHLQMVKLSKVHLHPKAPSFCSPDNFAN